MRCIQLAVAVVLLVALEAAPVAASSGVSVDLGRVDITDALMPGQAYSLPTLGVRNPGTEPTSYVMVASAVQDASLRHPDAAWFVFEPSALTLGPGETAQVQMRLVLPRDAAPGAYQVLLGAQISSLATGASVGAAAAARTTFSIRPANAIDAFAASIGQLVSDLWPWSAIVPSVFALASAGWLIRRRFAIHLDVRKRSAR